MRQRNVWPADNPAITAAPINAVKLPYDAHSRRVTPPAAFVLVLRIIGVTLALTRMSKSGGAS